MADPSDLTRTVRTKIHMCSCGCWVWTGSVDTSGYAKMKMRQRMIQVHRYVYTVLVGPIPDDLTVDHTCDRHRNCLNPEHFELVTRSENSRRANDRRWHGRDRRRDLCDDPEDPNPEDP